MLQHACLQMLHLPSELPPKEDRCKFINVQEAEANSQSFCFLINEDTLKKTALSLFTNNFIKGRIVRNKVTHQGKSSVSVFLSFFGTRYTKAVNIWRGYFPKATLLCTFKHITLKSQECQTYPFLNFPV